MKVGSMFAGIGGFDLGFERAGFEVAWCIEWDKNAQAVLRTRFPNAKVYGDITQVDPEQLEHVDVICGGFPCQDVSVAGKRAGLAGERSGLFHDAMRIVRRLNPSVLILENVVGLLSSNKGFDFATVLREVGEGWDCAEVGWRVLDSQYFGVAQRRRRVFVVGGSRIGCAESILALAESCGGDPPSRGTTREEPAADARGGASVGGIVGALDCDIPKQRVQNMMAGHWIPVAIQGNLIGRDAGGPHGVGASDSGTMYTLTRADVHGVAFPIQDGRGMEKDQNGIGVGSASDPAYTLDRTGGQSVAFRKSKRAQTDTDDETWVDDGLANTLNGFDTGDARTTHAVSTSMTVRRLTPTECERLQGFPDGWTQIGTDKPTADSHRYKQLGNAVTVNVAEWIARRVMRCLSS